MDQKIDSMIVGAQKSGTTALYRQLSSSQLCKHGSIEFTHFLYQPDKIDDYILREFKVDEESGEDKILIGKSACLYASESGLLNLKRHNEKVKLVLIVRDPVERAYSAYWYARQKGWETRVSPETAIFGKPLGAVGSARYINTSYLELGDYKKHIELMRSLFGAKSLLQVSFDVYKADPDSVLADVYEFLNVSGDLSGKLQVENKGRRVKNSSLAGLITNDTYAKAIFKKFVPKTIRNSIKRKVEIYNSDADVLPTINDNLSRRIKEYYSLKEK